MQIKLLLSLVFLITIVPTAASAMVTPVAEADHAERIQEAKDLVRVARSKKNGEKDSLLIQAAKLFRPVYTDRNADQNLRSEARTYLEAIYAKYPNLKLPRIAKMFAQEDKNLQIPEFNNLTCIPAQDTPNDEELIEDYFKDVDNRAAFSERIFGNELATIRAEKQAAAEKAAHEKAERKKANQEKAAAEKRAKEKAAQKTREKENRQKKLDADNPEKVFLDACYTLFSKKDYSECADSSWQLLQTSTDQSIQEKARELLQKLSQEKKDRDATYYLAVLNKENPEIMIDLFLQAERSRNLALEEKLEKQFNKQTKSAELINRKTDQKILSATSLAMATAAQALLDIDDATDRQAHQRACHVLATYFCKQATVVPNMKISLLERAVKCAEEAIGIPSIEGCFDYPQIANFLGLAIFESARDAHKNGWNKPGIIPSIDEAERLLKISIEGDNKDASYNLGAVQEYRFAELEGRIKLDEALLSYQKALEQGNSEAQKRIEDLLLQGIKEIPLNISYRKTLFDALKKFAPSSALLQKTDFNNSAYHARSQKTDIPGNKEFYEGLYWYDQGELERATALMEKARAQSHRAAIYFDINIDLENANDQIVLEVIQQHWKHRHEIDYVANVQFSLASEQALQRLINKNNIDAMYTMIHGHFKGHIRRNNNCPINSVCELMDKAESLMNKNSPSRSLITQDIFITELIQFTKETMNPAVLHKAASITIKRLNENNSTDQLQYLKLICNIIKTLKTDLERRQPVFMAKQESRAALAQEIDQFLAVSQEKNYSSALRALRSLLDGKLPDKSKSEQNAPVMIPNSPPPGLVPILMKTFSSLSYLTFSALNNQRDDSALKNMRALITSIRSNKGAALYAPLREKYKLATHLKNYIDAKKDKAIPTVADKEFIINAELLLIAERALVDETYDVDKACDEFCETYPLIGHGLVFEERLVGALFDYNKTKALEVVSKIENMPNSSKQ